MDIASAKAEMEKIEQAILLIDAASTSAENDYKNVINISDYVSNNKDTNKVSSQILHLLMFHKLSPLVQSSFQQK